MRTSAEINQEYVNLATKLGHLEHTLRIIPNQMNEISTRMAELNKEAAEAAEREKPNVQA